MSTELPIHIRQGPPEHQHITRFCTSEPAVQSHWNPFTLETLQTCPRKYKLAILDRWTAKRKKDALWWGGLYHGAIEFNTILRVKDELEFEEALLATVRYVLREAHGYISMDSTRTPATLVRAVVWYLDEYRHSPIQPVRLANGMPAIELDWELELPLISPDGVPYVLHSHFDEVARGPEEFLLIPERKTSAGAIGDGFMSQWKPNIQTAAYVTAAHVIFPQDRAEVVMQACQTLVGGNRYNLGSVRYSTAEQEEWLTDTLEWIKTAERHAAEGYWPGNYSSCSHYGGCEFREACSSHPSVRETVMKTTHEKLPSVWEIAGFRNFLTSIGVTGECPPQQTLDQMWLSTRDSILASQGRGRQASSQL